MPIPTENRALPQEPRETQRIAYSTCYMCACRCGIKLTLEGNQVRFIQGNRDHPVNQGVLCAKGSAGIMKQLSPAKLSKPLRRKPGAERGEAQFDEIEWDEALAILTARLKRIRGTDPKKLAFFTGRDQMQALTGLWAQQFGTPNWAAHGGFCSVNMAAAGLYTIGYSFWEFGAPDWERAKYFVLWGVAEDHSSNPIKIGLDKLKRNGAKFVSINPVRTGYSAIADEWIAIRPGTDGLLAMAILHVLLADGTIDFEFLARYTNAAWLVVRAPGTPDDGMFARDNEGRPLVFEESRQHFTGAVTFDTRPALFGSFMLDGRPVKTVLTLAAERYLDEQYAPEAVADRCGVPADTIRRLAREMAHVAFEQSITLPVRWTDVWGREHESVTGRPVAMYAMRGISAHSNGFHTCRALHFIQMLLGALDGPGNFRARAPYPKPIPPRQLPAKAWPHPNTPLGGAPLGFPTRPEDLAVDALGKPLRIDKAYSWEAPLAAHGLMHMVIANAVAHDPYGIDTLMLFMANMAWNSSMNTCGTREMLRAKDDDDEYRIPFIVVSDAFRSETVAFADLVLPDTTFLERYDAISLLDRPISEPDTPADAIRHPVIAPDRDVRPWQDVLVDLGGRLDFPAFTNYDGSPKFRDYRDFIIRYERAPGIGFLAGHRGVDGEKSFVGEPNPKQWDAYIANQSYFAWHLPEGLRWNRFANRGYLEFAKQAGFTTDIEPIVLQLWSEPLQRFRLAGEGVYAGPKPPNPIDAKRLAKFFDPLPFWHAPLEMERTDTEAFPLHAITQRPMMMYHSWDSQNAWLRQILADNCLYVNTTTAAAHGLGDGDWAWLESPHGRLRCRIKTMEGVEPSTVWTWNAVAKQGGAWGLSADAPEATTGFLLNHLISEHLPLAADEGNRQLTNSDPVTGQAAWYDVRVRLSRCAHQHSGTEPTFEPLPRGAAPNVLQWGARVE
ncbi:MAG TPA: molybdopterin oxidoreductase family protein [Casimicrobiaceae bacterium]|nr:molybdopterin oxidoreductase family protein [Casimicrobiaceae bacterium]